MSDTQRIWVIDRIEREVAVLIADDNRETVDIPMSVLPGRLPEGTVLRVPEGIGGPVWASAKLDEESRLERRREAEEVLDELRQRDPGGDILL